MNSCLVILFHKFPELLNIGTYENGYSYALNAPYVYKFSINVFKYSCSCD